MPHASAATSRNSEDASLRGRTYDIPFEDVWQGALRVARERLRGWAVDLTDDENGRISVDVRSRLRSLTGIVRIRITLDEQGQTRVDVASETPGTRRDWGTNARRVRRFLAALDREAPRERDRRRGAAPAR